MYKLIFAVAFLSTISINAQTTTTKPISTYNNQIEKSKGIIKEQKETIIKSNTALVEGAKARVILIEEKYQKATLKYQQEKEEYKINMAKEKTNIQTASSEIKKYK